MTRAVIGLVIAGVALAVAAIIRDDRRISVVAIVLLAAALALRLAARRRMR